MQPDGFVALTYRAAKTIARAVACSNGGGATVTWSSGPERTTRKLSYSFLAESNERLLDPLSHGDVGTGFASAVSSATDPATAAALPPPPPPLAVAALAKPCTSSNSSSG